MQNTILTKNLIFNESWKKCGEKPQRIVQNLPKNIRNFCVVKENKENIQKKSQGIFFAGRSLKIYK